ncbi:calcium-dependent kinase [Raphidocelis subcapitata]|uniref:Calcium-dependent kinase n=1 Tax=Raphidocelis subcapitata TaxID=307507 RepID=A0A2V0PJ99_9CHLO|nr:calcium-dependent kinase [Raphidocelis subcapitata]|eukprot:GBF97387.1 calcium-dependent kinase [Raphidocelis subcapitata]
MRAAGLSHRAAAGCRAAAAAGRRMARPRPLARAPARGRARRALAPVALLDYVASISDDGVLRLPARTELSADEIKQVFGFPRRIFDRYTMGKVIGAGSFGTVREAFDKATGARYAVKTVSKVPKRGAPTPRYLLKLRAEVEVMAQLGVSLNAVALIDAFEDDANVHMVMELCEGGALLERVESRAYSEAYIAGLVRSILRFIAQCHAKGIVYRDVKPAPVLKTPL